MIVVNKNAKLRVGGRKAPSMSESEFINILENKFKDLDFSSCEVYDFFYDLWESNNKFSKDLEKIEVDFENVGKADEFYELEDGVEYLHESLPIMMTKNGVPFLCCSGGGDWEVPVVFMIYWDGKNFRGYIPTKGNPWNTKAKAAFNNDEDADVEFMESHGYTEDDIEELVADINMCVEDFENRIEVTNANTTMKVVFDHIEWDENAQEMFPNLPTTVTFSVAYLMECSEEELRKMSQDEIEAWIDDTGADVIMDWIYDQIDWSDKDDDNWPQVEDYRNHFIYE